jgi:tetratricopeptide (TPR) repeat protein/TolB-like protein
MALEAARFDDPTNPQARFAEGEVLAGRFRIVRFLARGGVGEVYEAEDLTLRARVALKTLRPELAAHEQVFERFRREILLGRQVTHPNVCRSFDLFLHRMPSTAGPDEDVAFVTMEFLEGQTLAERLRHSGPLGMAEALPLVEQLSSGLAAAHRAGVIHRDLKSANIMLVPASGDPRAVITDFGLARRFEPHDDPLASLTGTGGFLGTSAYMAPEQVEGGNVTAAADIYALGIVIYEMVTGHRPFVADSALATAVLRLKEPPVSPRTWVRALDPKWEQMILACLEREPARRPAHADEIAAPLAKNRPTTARTGALLAYGSRRRRLSVAALAIAILLGTLFAGRSVLPQLGRGAAGRGASAPSAGRRSVAVLGFRNLSGRADTAWLSPALSETLAAELAIGETLRIVSGEDIARMKLDLPIGDVDGLASDTLKKVRLHVGADLVVLGSYLDLGKEAAGRVRFDLRIQDAANGETIASITEAGTEDAIFDVVSRVGSRLREKLGIPDGVATETSGRPGLSLPATPTALRLYSEGVARLRVLDALEARQLLESAVAADPSYFPARVALSQAWSALGYQRKAFDEANTALRLCVNASREQRLWVEARSYETSQQWERAVATYHALWRLFPDDLDYGLRLAEAQTAGGRPRDAFATVQTLRTLPPPAGNDPRIALIEAHAARVLSDFKRMRDAAAAAVASGRVREARMVVARALVLEGRALQQLGQVKDAMARFEEARDAFARAGDRDNLAWTLVSVGIARWSSGDSSGSETIFRDALAEFRAIGDQKGVGAALNTLGMVLWKRGRLTEATKVQEQSLAAFHEINDRESLALLLNNRAVVFEAQGDLTRAAEMYEQALGIAREHGEKREIGATLSNLASILRERGDLEEARQRYQEAVAANEDAGLKSGAATSRYLLSELLLFMGRFDEARKEGELALAVRETLGEKLLVAESRVALANLALEEGRPAQAEALAREALQQFQGEKSRDDEALAEAVIARALHAQGKVAESRESLTRAVQLAGKSQAQSVRLSVAILDARLRAAAGGGAADRASKALEGVLAEAKRAGLTALQLEVRLALAEVGLSAGRPDAAATLAALEKEAASRGFGLVARKAAVARQPRSSASNRF